MIVIVPDESILDAIFLLDRDELRTLVRRLRELGLSPKDVLEDVFRMHCSTDADAPGADDNDWAFIEECVGEWLDRFRDVLEDADR